MVGCRHKAGRFFAAGFNLGGDGLFALGPAIWRDLVAEQMVELNNVVAFKLRLLGSTVVYDKV